LEAQQQQQQPCTCYFEHNLEVWRQLWRVGEWVSE
jgi:hypothetical protein